MGTRANLGQTAANAAGSAAGTAAIKLAPATGPAAPFVAAAGAVVSLFSKILNFGYNPQKLNDTAITEAVKQALNQLWYQLTGEAINGVHRTAEPGQYGKAGIALFRESRYPDVPYPAGAPGADPAQIIGQAQQIISQARSNLLRKESAAGYDFNANYMLELMNQVAERRAEENPLSRIIPGGSKLPGWLPWAAAGYAVYKWVL